MGILKKIDLASVKTNFTPKRVLPLLSFRGVSEEEYIYYTDSGNSP
ncbi:hypothetical protein [Chlorobium phaeovibrioides]|nr:hypothetical protein [Chlorobium phaeovibrioides]